jgi:hypothetical protein
LKRQIYTPVGHATAEFELLQIRQALTKALTADGLKVITTEPPHTGAGPG